MRHLLLLNVEAFCREANACPPIGRRQMRASAEYKLLKRSSILCFQLEKRESLAAQPSRMAGFRCAAPFLFWPKRVIFLLLTKVNFMCHRSMPCQPTSQWTT